MLKLPKRTAMKSNLFLIIFFTLLLLVRSAIAQLSVTFSISNYNGYSVSCFGGNNGWIVANISGGTPPYSIMWSTLNGDTTDSISGLSANYYSVIVTDSDSTVIEDGVNLTSPTALVVSLTSSLYPNKFNVSCFGCFNGSITTDVSGGLIPYSYFWTDSVLAADRIGLEGGGYTIKVTDNNECLSSENIFLSEPNGSWTVNGNSDTDPGVNFLGTINNKDLAFKTDGIERLRIASDGKITSATNVFWDKLLVNRISSLDTVIYVGDSTLIFNGNNQTIYGTTSGTYKGLGLGNSQNKCEGIGAVGIGVVSLANGNQSVSIGNFVKTSAAGSVVIGKGIGGNNFLENITSNSLWIGFNSDVPTLVVSASNGSGTIGNVGIGTTSPDQKLVIKHNEYHGGIVLDRDDLTSAHSQIYFKKQGVEKWAIGNDSGEDGSQDFFIWDNVAQESRLYIDDAGRVAIGTMPPTAWTTGVNYKLYVGGGIATRDVKVTSALNWPDYVFEKSYDLLSIYDLETFIKRYKHMPCIPSATEIEQKNGFEVGDLISRLVQNNEEQVLYIISLQKQLDEQQGELEQLKQLVLKK